MCDILMETTEDDYLIELCGNITLTQRAEISWMYQWLTERDQAITAPCKECDEASMVMMEPCEDILSTSSFCHGVSGNNQDGDCRCPETLEANGFICDEPSWVEGVGLFLPEVYCKRTCGKCPEDMRPLWVPTCEGDDSGMDHSGMGDDDRHGMDHSGMDGNGSHDSMGDGGDIDLAVDESSGSLVLPKLFVSLFLVLALAW